MAQETPRMAIPYPDENQDPFFNTFRDAMNAIDGHDFASFEDRNIFVTGGALFTWDSVTGILTWASDIRIVSPSTGIVETLVAGSIAVPDGYFMTVDLTRGPTDTVTLIVSAVSRIDPDDAPLAIGARVGTRFYFRNGSVLQSGGTATVFDEAASGGSSGIDRVDQYTGDGIQSLYTLSFTPNIGSEPFVFQAGVFMGLNLDYSRPNPDEIQFLVAPVNGRPIEVRYYT